jgi:hypothetical protein
MNPQDNPNWQRKLEELEVEINATPISEGNTNPTPPYQSKLTEVLTMVTQWFNQLPSLGKIIVAVAGVMMTLSLLSTVLKLVTALISLSILGVFLYITYRLLIASRT